MCNYDAKVRSFIHSSIFLCVYFTHRLKFNMILTFQTAFCGKKWKKQMKLQHSIIKQKKEFRGDLSTSKLVLSSSVYPKVSSSFSRFVFLIPACISGRSSLFAILLARLARSSAQPLKPRIFSDIVFASGII